MKVTYKEKQYDIPTDEIKSLMKKLGCDAKEAVKVWMADRELMEDEEQNALDEKASKVKVNKNASGEKKERKERAPRKPNEEKRELIQLLFSTLPAEYHAQIANPEKEITFAIGDNDYSITLTQHRKKKE